MCRYSGVHARLIGRRYRAASARGLGLVLRVGHRLQPRHMLAALMFLHGDVLHAVLRRGAVAVLLARRKPDRIAGADLTDRTAPGLHMADAGGDVQSLSKRMGMPGGARARLEAHPGRAQERWIGRLDDRILPHRSGEARRAHAARRPRSASNNVHGYSLPVLYSYQIVFFAVALSSTIDAHAKSPASPPGFRLGEVLKGALRRLQIASRLLATLGDDLVADLLAFDQRTHAGLLERGDVHEHIFGAVIRLNKAEAFLGIEELHSSSRHRSSFHASR